MAVDFIGSIDVWQGLASDDKPTATPESPIKVGSTYQELDEDRRLWVYRGSQTVDGGWEIQDTGVQKVFNLSDFEAPALNKFQTMIDILRRINSDD